ncbi:cholesterol transport system auxiliary component [Rhodovulum bhavnagarense]|uniref:Cholesterol transport system auxiliary component n=1 Tax=Rhodovulum bhavnagarense TaxID=992286 RepID=A0A4R2RGF5_9RHOB|nr:ABC-type transport auxiliary lipoprotein family protein [Rhodovulum bhavnagarense]TCP61648.1 cholesterol transport system auxiliary component [Rhodovulum bhavnagarense]
MQRLVFLVLSVTLALPGCSAIGALGRAGGPPQDVFEIRAPADLPVARSRAGDVDFIIAVPAASGALDTDGIMVRPGANQVQYLPDARWSENAPVMVQSALVEGFERTGAFGFVGRRPLAGSGDLALVSSLTDFNAEILPDRQGAVIRMTLMARLVREDDAAVLASRRFSEETVVTDTRDAAILAGYVSAAERVLFDLTAWVLSARNITTF